MEKETKKTALQLAYASTIGISMAIAIFGSLFLGVWLDRKWGTGPYLTLLFLLLGIVAGFRNMVLLIRRSAGGSKSAPQERQATKRNIPP